MEVNIKHTCENYDSFRANKVKSLFNAESGYKFEHTANIPAEGDEWQIGLVVGASGSGKTSIGKQLWDDVDILDLDADWDPSAPIVDGIAPAGDFTAVTGALAAVGLGDVPAWLRPYKVLSNGEKFRAGLARLMCESPKRAIVDEFTSVVDRQIARIGASAFAKSWRRETGRQVVLLSCHYDIIEWLQPDWVYDTGTGKVKKGASLSQDQSLSSKFGRSTEATGSILSRITI